MNLQMNQMPERKFPEGLPQRMNAVQVESVAQVTAFFQAHRLDQKRLLLAISGGKDSLYLACCCHQFRQMWNQQVELAHVNHCSQPENELHARWVRQFAEDFAFPLHETALDPELWHEGFQEAHARKLRYNWLEQVALEQEFDAILTAHQQDDDVETILFRLFRGTGLKGLKGIPAVRLLERKTPVYRPLLSLSAQQIINSLQQWQMPWLSDRSNTNTKYTRNWIRQELLPLLRSQSGFHLPDSVLNLSQQAEEIQHYLQSQVEPVLFAALEQWENADLRELDFIEKQQVVHHFNTATVTHICLDALALKPVPMVLRRELFMQLISLLNWPQQKLGATHWQQMAELIDQPGKRAEFPGKITYLHRQKKIRLQRTSS